MNCKTKSATCVKGGTSQLSSVNDLPHFSIKFRPLFNVNARKEGLNGCLEISAAILYGVGSTARTAT